MITVLAFSCNVAMRLRCPESGRGNMSDQCGAIMWSSSGGLLRIVAAVTKGASEIAKHHRENRDRLLNSRRKSPFRPGMGHARCGKARHTDCDWQMWMMLMELSSLSVRLHGRHEDPHASLMRNTGRMNLRCVTFVHLITKLSGFLSYFFA